MNLLKINKEITDNLEKYILDNFNQEITIEVEAMQNNASKLYLVINSYGKLKNKVDYYQVFCKIIEKQSLDIDNSKNLLNNLLSNKFEINGNNFYFGNSIDVLQRVGGNDYGLFLGLDFEAHIYITPTEHTFTLKTIEMDVEGDIIIINKEDKKRFI